MLATIIHPLNLKATIRAGTVYVCEGQTGPCNRLKCEVLDLHLHVQIDQTVFTSLEVVPLPISNVCNLAPPPPVNSRGWGSSIGFQ